jgi:hypothetical protein
MFSFNGYGTPSKWNGLGGAEGRADQLSSQQEMIKSKFAESEEVKGKTMRKMTSTQMKFGGGYNDGRDSSEDSRTGFNNNLKKKTGKFNEESKGSSLPRGIGAKKKTGGKAPKVAKANKSGKKKTIDITENANRRNSIGGSQEDMEDMEDYESRNHSESDEAVDDGGAAFQNRNGPDAYNGYERRARKASNEDEELEHSESEEGNN